MTIAIEQLGLYLIFPLMIASITKWILRRLIELVPKIFGLTYVSVFDSTKNIDVAKIVAFIDGKNDYGTRGTKNSVNGFVYGKWYFGLITSQNSDYGCTSYDIRIIINPSVLTKISKITDDTSKTINMINITGGLDSY